MRHAAYGPLGKTPQHEGHHVTVYLDALKNTKVSRIPEVLSQGDCYVLAKENDREAKVKKIILSQLPSQLKKGACELLPTWTDHDPDALDA